MQLGYRSLGDEAQAMRRRRSEQGYLLVLVAICMSILSLSYLRLASSAAVADDKAENEVARLSALYAAESGLVIAEQKLAEAKTAPPVGTWFQGDMVNSRYKVSVSTKEKGSFTIVSVGTSEGEAGVLVTRSLQGQARFVAKRGWLLEKRRER